MLENKTKLYNFEQKVVNAVVHQLNQNHYIAIKGGQGTGKSSILKAVMDLMQNKDSVCIFAKCDKSQYNIHNSIYREILTKGEPKIDVSVGFSLSICNIGATISFTQHKSELSQMKQYMKKLIRGKIAYFVIDDINFCGYDSLYYLKKIASDITEDVNFIVSLDETNICDINLNNLLNEFTYVPVAQITQNEFWEIFDSFLLTQSTRNISSEIKNIIYNICQGNLNAIQIIANAYENHSLVLNRQEICDDDNLLKKLIIKTVNNFTNSRDITTALNYGSLIGLEFPVVCIDYVMENADLSLKTAEKINLIKLEDAKAKFVLQYVKDIFSPSDENIRLSYCNKLADCFRELYPSEYGRRAMLQSFTSDHRKASLLYTLHCLQRLKRCNTLDIEYLNKITVPEHKNFMNNYKIAWNRLQSENYLDCINLSQQIFSTVEPELKAEEAILFATAAIKIQDQTYRAQASNNISSYLELVNNEKDVWFRLNIRYANLLIHCGEYDKAESCFAQIINSLSNDKSLDNFSEYLINSIKRKANCFRSYDVAQKDMKEAISFYMGESKEYPRYLKQYYIALNNYAAFLGELAKWSEAEEYLSTINELIDFYPEFVFPRRYIYEHNKTMIEYFNDRISAQEAIAKLFDILQHGNSLDLIFIKSNIAILYAENNAPNKAEDILNQLKKSVNVDYEEIYSFCVNYNYAIVNYILNADSSKTLDLLDNITVPNIVDKSYLFNKVQQAKAIVGDNIHPNGRQWRDAILSRCPNFRNDSWRFWGLGYDFNLLYDWDDD